MHKTHTHIEKATHENFRYEFYFWRMAMRRLYTLAPYGYWRIKFSHQISTNEFQMLKFDN